MSVILNGVYVKLILGYKGYGKKVGVLNFANGQTFRFFFIAVHVWKPSERNWKPFKRLA